MCVDGLMDPRDWSQFYCTQNRVVARETVWGECDYEVSTVFLGVNYAFFEGPPILWESMIFGEGPLGGTCRRCSGTREQAEAMHRDMVAWLTEELNKPKET